MGKLELILLTLAIMIFSSFAVIAMQNQVDSRLELVRNEIRMSAYSEMESILNYANSLAFDDFTAGKFTDNIPASDSHLFTDQGNLGWDNSYENVSHIDSIPKINDLDDLNQGYPNPGFSEKTVKVHNDEGELVEFYTYHISIEVNYVQEDGTPATNPPTPQKKLVIELVPEFPNLQNSSSPSDTLKTSKVFYYQSAYNPGNM